MMTDDFAFLQDWYARHCDGDWEHDERIRIGTIDNPGWMLSINIADTELSGRTLPWELADRDDDDWLHYRCEGDVFQAACGVSNFPQALAAFRSFVEAA